jgi:hypothetical protein
MPSTDYTAAASVTWQHPPYGATAIEEFADEFSLAEAVRFVMERLQPAHRVQARINAGGKEYRLAEIEELYRRSDFPLGQFEAG